MSQSLVTRRMDSKKQIQHLLKTFKEFQALEKYLHFGTLQLFNV